MIYLIYMVKPADFLVGLIGDIEIQDAAELYGYEGFIPYGFIQDLLYCWTNLIEYNDCKSVASTGNQYFILNFDGLEIYRNHSRVPKDHLRVWKNSSEAGRDKSCFTRALRAGRPFFGRPLSVFS